jgi:hypothetical protein
MSVAEQIEKEKIVATYNPGAEVRGEGWLSLHRNENLFVGRAWTVEAAKRLIEQAEIAAYLKSLRIAPSLLQSLLTRPLVLVPMWHRLVGRMSRRMERFLFSGRRRMLERRSF